VVVDFDGRRVLDCPTLVLPSGGVKVVVGPSGSGKSTLLRLLNRLEVPSDGNVRYRGTDVAAIPAKQLRRSVGMVFQRPVVFGGTVSDNLSVADPEAGRAAHAEVLGRCGLDAELADREAATLSGGEAQRMCLARTLLTRPDVLLMDEPTSALDPTARGDLEALTRHLVAEGVDVVWVTHDLDQMRRLGDFVVVLIDGRPRFDGTPDTIARCGDTDVAAFLAGELR